MTMQRTMKLYRLPEASGAPGPWAGARENREAGFGGGGGCQKTDSTHCFQIPDFPFPLFSIAYSKGFILV